MNLFNKIFLIIINFSFVWLFNWDQKHKINTGEGNIYFLNHDAYSGYIPVR